MKAISKRMLELRESVNLSQMKLSKELGLSQSAINRYENNKGIIPDTALLKYAEFFDISLDYLFGRTDKPEGIIFNNEPEIIKRKVIRNNEWEDFVEACFDPRSPMNKRLKELIMQMADGGQ